MATSSQSGKRPTTTVSRASFEKVTKEMERLATENQRLRTQLATLDALKTHKEIAVGEAGGISERLREQRNHMTLKLAQVLDVLRSATSSVHKIEHHGSYAACGHPWCILAREQWETVDGVRGYELILSDPNAFWQEREEDQMATAAVATETGANTTATVADVPRTPTEIDAPELAELFPGKRLRRLPVLPPDKEKDPDDPGLPEQAQI